jgi:hypothetical protein
MRPFRNKVGVPGNLEGKAVRDALLDVGLGRALGNAGLESGV